MINRNLSPALISNVRRYLLLAILLFCCQRFYGQEYEYKHFDQGESTYHGYLKIYPFTKKIKGLIVRDFTRLPDMEKPRFYQFIDLCLKAGYMILITDSSEVIPELFVDDTPMQRLDKMIKEVVQDDQIPEQNIFIGGISASGTRALRFAQYCASGQTKLSIKGVFAVDSPLDLARFYKSAATHQQNFSGGMLEEANYIVPYFEKLFDGTTDNSGLKYSAASVFSHDLPDGGNAALLKDVDILFFHEPDINWWIQERGASYYDMNSYDIAALTVLLRRLGNDDVDLVTTSGRGYDREGNRKPHSWSIVDEKYLLEWMRARTD